MRKESIRNEEERMKKRCQLEKYRQRKSIQNQSNVCQSFIIKI